MSILKIRDADGNEQEVLAIRGEPGHTPERGTDYWTEADKEQIINDVIAELPGGGGSGGGGGADGFSPIATVTQTDSGATITITDKNGTTTATVTNGKDGADGYSPVKGTDYWTEADKAEMVADVIASLPVYNGEVV